MSSQQKVDNTQHRVLIADDFPTMQQALVACLEPLPQFQVVGTASNGKEALQMTTGLNPDVVIADLQMPVMDGFQLLRELRHRYPTIYLIAISGHYSNAIEKEALSAGANTFVSKVGLPEALITALQSICA